MAYSNFPVNYQPMTYQQQNAMPQQYQNPGIIWVSGEAGAKAYMLAPNTTVPLWDSEAQSIYLKSTDASGMPSIKVLDYVIRDNPQPQAPVATEKPDFVTHDELQEFETRVSNAIQELKEAKNESYGNRSNGRRSKKQSNVDAE